METESKLKNSYGKEKKEMKKTMIVLVIILTLCLLVLLVGEVLGGGLNIDFEAIDETSEVFAKEFIGQMKKQKRIIAQLVGDYWVQGYVGAMPDEETGELKSVIGIFINDQKKVLIKIWRDELFSGDEIKRKAKEAADIVLKYLIEQERNNLIKIPV